MEIDKKIIKKLIETLDDLKKSLKDKDILNNDSPVEKEIQTDEIGNFKCKVMGRVDLYSDDSFLGNENLLIQMTLKLAPPRDGQRWKLEIQNFGWEQLK